MYQFKVYDEDGDEVQVIETDLEDCSGDEWCYRIWVPRDKQPD